MQQHWILIYGGFCMFWIHRSKSKRCPGCSSSISPLCSVSQTACSLLSDVVFHLIPPFVTKGEAEAYSAAVSHSSCPRLRNPMDYIAHQAPLSMEFLRQEYWSGSLFPPPGDLPIPGIEHGSPALQADSLPSEPPEKPGVYNNLTQTEEWNHNLVQMELDP